MRILSALALALFLTATSSAAIRPVSGVGLPTTETPGGGEITGTLDWGDPSDISGVEYSLDWDSLPELSGKMELVATSIIPGGAVQVIWQDEDNEITMSAISASGPYVLDPDQFSAFGTPAYGGFEFWSLTYTASDKNLYGSLVEIVPEGEAKHMAAMGGVGLLLFCGYWIRARSDRSVVARLGRYR